MTAAQDRAEALVKRIGERAKEFVGEGFKDGWSAATAGVLAAELIKSLERIERLEGDIKLLTDLLANVESNR